MIPKNLYLTFRDEILPKVYQENLNRWKTFYPDWDIQYFSNARVHAFFKEHFPYYADDLHKIHLGATLADVFRYGAIYMLGGMYTDIDTFPEKKVPEKWLSNDVVLGYEYQPSKFECENAPFFPNDNLCQWTFLSKPKHPFFKKILDRSFEELRRINFEPKDPEELLWVTGPGIFHQVAKDYMHDPGFLILDMDFFASDTLEGSQERAVVRHQFHGKHGWCIQAKNPGIQLFSQKQ